MELISYRKPTPRPFTMWPEEGKSVFGFGLDLWVDAYHDGIRIVPTEKGFLYQSVTAGIGRIFEHGQFGYFGTLLPVEPPEWLETLAEDSRKEIEHLFPTDKAIPESLRRFFGHILILDGEFMEVVAHAASLGGSIGGHVVRGGRIPFWQGQRDPSEVKTRQRPEISSSIRSIEFA